MNTQKDKKGENEAELFKQLQRILLSDDRQKIQKIEETVYAEKNLSKEISPIIEEHIEFLKKNFPDEFRVVVDKMIAAKIQDSREEIVNAIYPEVGKMIKKYVSHQIQMLKEGIENQVKSTFNSKSFFGKIKSTLGWKSTSEEIIQNLHQPVIEEIFIIQKDSGLLAGSATRNKLIDQDVIAGMLTAIKAFVEDAFNKGNESLETIEYGSYRILLQNFPSWYMAIALSGTLSAKEKDKLSDEVLNFASQEMSFQIEQIDDTLHKKLSKKLEQYFIQEKITQN